MVKKYGRIISSGSNLPTDLASDVVNLESDLSLQELYQQLKQSINSPKPRLLKVWGNRKLELDAERTRWLISQIDAFGDSIDSLARVKAKMLLTPQMIQDLVNGYYAEAKLKAEEMVTKLHEQDMQRKTREAELKRKDLENEKLEAENTLIKLQAELLKKVVNEMEIENITASQAFVLIKALDPKSDDNLDFQSKEKMVEEELAKMREENRIIRSEAELAELNVQQRKDDKAQKKL